MKPQCDENCNECPIILHNNARVLTVLLNALFDRYGGGVSEIVGEVCPNLTCCAQCRTDDFVHFAKCGLEREAGRVNARAPLLRDPKVELPLNKTATREART